MSSNNLFCFIDRSPSLASSKEAANMPAVPDLRRLFSDKKLVGIRSFKFFQSKSLPKNSLILLIPSSVVKTGNL